MLISAFMAFMLSGPVAEAPPVSETEFTAEASPSGFDYPQGRCALTKPKPAPGPGEEDIEFEPQPISMSCVAICEDPDGDEYNGVIVSPWERPVTGEYNEWCERKAADFCDQFGLFLNSWCWGVEDD